MGVLPLGVSWSDVQRRSGGEERRASLGGGGEAEVKAFHHQMRDCCSLMGVGIGDR